MLQRWIIEVHNRQRHRTTAAFACTLICMFAIAPSFASGSQFQWQLPAWMSPPNVPSTNPMSTDKVELGRHLFFDIRLSGPGYMACGTCHKPERAFTDGRKTAIGITGQLHTRNTPTLANVAYLSRFGWAQPKREPLELQLRRPMFLQKPIIEMGTRGHEVPVLRHVQSNSIYRRLFRSSFPGREPSITFETIGLAIAAFQRSIISGTSPFDQYREGDKNALSPSAKRGLQLFTSNRLQCSTCHTPPFFTDAVGAPAFHNTGLYNVDGKGGLPGTDQGLANETGKPKDNGRFRTPTLRNVAVTAPYMHDGSINTLGDVIDHYAAGGEAARKGRPSPIRSNRIRGFEITEQQRADLLAFLASLTDVAFLKNPRYQTPYR